MTQASVEMDFAKASGIPYLSHDDFAKRLLPKLNKILEQLQAELLALLWVELRCEEIASADRCAEWMSIFGFKPYTVRVFRDHVIAVNEIEV